MFLLAVFWLWLWSASFTFTRGDAVKTPPSTGPPAHFHSLLCSSPLALLLDLPVSSSSPVHRETDDITNVRCLSATTMGVRAALVALGFLLSVADGIPLRHDLGNMSMSIDTSSPVAQR